MKPRALALALMATGTVLPGLARAELTNLKPEDSCPVMILYAISQACSLLSNGQTQCQPVGVVGPSPSCPKSGLQPLMQVPLAPPVVRAPAPQPYAALSLPAPAPYGVPFGWPPGWPGVAAPYGFAPYGMVPGAMPPGFAPPGFAPQLAQGTRPAIPAPVSTPPAPEAPKPAAAPMAAPAADKPASPPVEPAAAPQPATPPAAPAVTPPPAPAPVARAESAAPPAAPPTAPTPAPVAAPANPAPEAAAQALAQKTLEDALAHFDFDSATLTDKGREILDAWLARYPRATPVRVTGHADRLGPEPYNLDLSRKRAETVRQYLRDKGVEDRFISLVAKGEAEPVKRCKGGPTPATKDCLAPNRRVVIDPE